MRRVLLWKDSRPDKNSIEAATSVNEFEVGQLAQNLCNGYIGFSGVTTIIRHPRAEEVIRQLELDNSGPARVPTEQIYTKHGAPPIYFDLIYAVKNIAASPGYREVHDRLWLTGALLTLGDELARQDYFDKKPDLEFIRHLRNGIGHGNCFNLRPGEPRRPAFYTGPDDRTSAPPTSPYSFEITPTLNGRQVLFDFIGPGDVCQLLQFVSWRLIRIGNGDPPLDLWPQRP